MDINLIVTNNDTNQVVVSETMPLDAEGKDKMKKAMPIATLLHEITGGYYTVSFEEKAENVTLPDNQNCKEGESSKVKWENSKNSKGN